MELLFSVFNFKATSVWISGDDIFRLNMLVTHVYTFSVISAFG